jgi:aldose 1-epimerase
MKATPSVYTLADGEGTRLEVSDRGATWLSCRVPLAGGGTRQVMLGHASAADHGVQRGYLGSVVGRWANRICGARFALDGRTHTLAANEAGNLLHGGVQGFDKRDWQVVAHDDRSITLALVSDDGDQGFPGRLDAEVRYAIVAPGHVHLAFTARADQATPVNLTSHAYFNLDGTEPRPGLIDGHVFAIDASRVLPVDAALIPQGPLQPVAGTAYDLRTPQRLGERAFDHNFVFDAAGGDVDAPRVRVVSSDGRLRLSIATDYPGVQFYTGQWLAQSSGRDGRPHRARTGFALEPQYFPDSPNHADDPAWRQAAPDGTEPGWLLRPGRTWRQHIHYRFDTPA